MTNAAPLRVMERSGRFRLVDEFGRERVVRGINLATMGGRNHSGVPIDPDLYAEGKCPPNDPAWFQPPICENDIRELRAHGFDAVRLLVHWSHIEPTPGTYSEMYFRRINQIVDWAEAAGVDVLVDFHEDNFANISRACCPDDGAPAWAWLVDESQLTVAEKVEIAVLKKLVPQLEWAGAELAFQSFWINRPVPATGIGLQTHYIQAVAATVNATMGRRGVVGWELMNEPQPGLDIRLLHFSDQVLYPFYARIIQALTGVRDGKPTCPCTITPGGTAASAAAAAALLKVQCSGGESLMSAHCAYPDLGLRTDKLMVFEPMAVRNQLDVSMQLSGPFSSYPNIVYAPHTYTRSFTVFKQEPFWAALATALVEAHRMRAGVLVTEWGGSDLANVRAIEAQQGGHAVSGMHWVWKQNDPEGWSLHETADGQRFTIREDRLRVASRIHPRAVAGEILNWRQDNETFAMQARCNSSIGAAANYTTDVFVPPHFASCLGSLSVNGSARLGGVARHADGSATVAVLCDEASDSEFGVWCSLEDFEVYYV